MVLKKNTPSSFATADVPFSFFQEALRPLLDRASYFSDGSLGGVCVLVVAATAAAAEAALVFLVQQVFFCGAAVGAVAAV